MTTVVDQISQAVQADSATAKESAAAREELFRQARLIKELAGKFKIKKQ